MADINVKINKVYMPLLDNTSRYEILYGGAGSGKSRFTAQKKVLQHMNDKGRKTLVIRKVKNSIRNSVFEEIKTTINDMGVAEYFNIPNSQTNFDISCANGNKFIFSGVDDPEKLKSISGVTDIWIEEATELTQKDFQQIDLRLRGKSVIPQQITLTFNPVSSENWVKSHFFDSKILNCKILKTTYKDNAFLDDDYVSVLDNLKYQDYQYYKVYCLGEWGTLGNIIFNNWSVKDFEPDPKMFKTIVAGLDFGYNDPTAYIEVGFKEDKMYILRELYETGLTTPTIGDKVEFIRTGKYVITADSSEPDRIDELKKRGWKIRAAQKGPGSIKAGLDFLKRHEIVIHPDCHNFVAEIRGYKYKEDKNGIVFDEPVDFKNHLMDALRYATEEYRKDRRMKSSFKKTSLGL